MIIERVAPEACSMHNPACACVPHAWGLQVGADGAMHACTVLSTSKVACGRSMHVRARAGAHCAYAPEINKKRLTWRTQKPPALGPRLSRAWVALRRDAEEADIAKERVEQEKGPAARAHELEELTQIYEERGISRGLARQVRVRLNRQPLVHRTWRPLRPCRGGPVSRPVMVPACRQGHGQSCVHPRPVPGPCGLAGHMPRAIYGCVTVRPRGG